LLMSQAMARLPIYPEIVSTDGRINLTAPVTGTVRVPGGVNLLHRGINLVTTAETDFNTIASRTYHLRWNPTDGFVLKYLLDGVYNPTTLAETDPTFDSTFDDMLVARIITNASNVATITSLANLNRKETSEVITGVAVGATGINEATFDFTKTWNYGRTPRVLNALATRGSEETVIDRDYRENNKVETRYTWSVRITDDFATSLTHRLIGIM